MLRTNVLLPLLCFLAGAANANDAKCAIDLAVASVTKPSAANTTNENICCKALQYALGPKVFYSNSTAYSNFSDTFYSLQEAELSPSCIVKPTSSYDVSVSVGILSFLANHTSWSPSCSFAIKSGGHAPNQGNANADKGVTIDLSIIRDVSVSTDKSLVSVGPAATWGEVYSELDKYQITVPGGRVSTVGVGGLTVGGGISFFSPRKGFTCDSVKNFEVVIANGTILNANAQQNSDLWLALKGGANNLGVVTRIDFYTFQQGDMWGGNILYDISTAEKQINALSDFTGNGTYDEYASLISTFVYQPAIGPLIANNLIYTKPVANPPIYKPFTTIEPQYLSTMRISNTSDISAELLAPTTHLRTIFMTTTFKANKAMLNTTFTAWNASLAALGEVENLTWSVSVEPLPTNVLAKSAATGGNVLGLTTAEGPLIILFFRATWEKKSDDDLVTKTAKDLFAKIEAFAKAEKYYNKWQYLNYAASWQDPIAGYGEENHAKLRRTSIAYDLEGVFQRAVTGGFKLFVGWGWI
ncbi:hypothetical protein EYC80_001397 [Monilinia laxa]|uniref:FAD-binding PCMH-type domain-containing protein n=1 Tax=Monilinia laxa TaxID=61186 RepID=A0A5N6K9C4_MONLA|nr:hypothetical protein EYC80_001397 [Monilinia laxa]